MGFADLRKRRLLPAVSCCGWSPPRPHPSSGQVARSCAGGGGRCCLLGSPGSPSGRLPDAPLAAGATGEQFRLWPGIRPGPTSCGSRRGRKSYSDAVDTGFFFVRVLKIRSSSFDFATNRSEQEVFRHMWEAAWARRLPLARVPSGPSQQGDVPPVSRKGWRGSLGRSPWNLG